jgi:hypothetical protein
MSKHTVPESLRRQVEEAIRTGAPLPKGVVAVGPGQAAPPGAVPLGNFDPKHPAMAKKESQNPLPSGVAGYRVIREGNECNVPAETANINTMMDKVLNGIKGGDEEKIEELVRDSVAKGLVVALRVDQYCAENSSHREVLSFEAHPELDAIQKRMKELEKESAEIQDIMKALVAEGKELLEKRWSLAVKLGGLSPENNYYVINEDRGVIEMVELNCHECKGAVKIRKARQALETGIPS